VDEQRKGRARIVLVFGVAAGVGLIGAWLGMALFAQTTVPMGPFRVELDAGFGKGDTRLDLPPFGSLSADTHVSPLHLSATLHDVGVERLTEVVERRGIDGLVADVERDALDRVQTLAWRVLVVGALGGVALGLVVFRNRWRLVAAAFTAAVLGVAGCEVAMLATYRPAAFSEPTYSGSLELAPKLIGPVRDATDRIDDFRASLEQIVDGTVRAYTSLQTSPLGDDAIRVLHVSDIHASPLGMEFALQVARGFEADMVLDTGDTTSFATPVENLIVLGIREFDVPYVFVRGSHDSLALQAEIARQPNAVVLDGRAQEVDGLRIYGLGHPAFTPARGVPVDDEVFEELTRAAGLEIAADLDAMDEPVDLIAVHDDRMAESVAGRIPLVLSGHFHETNGRVLNGTLFLRIGTTGGSGAGIFRGLDIPFTAEVLYFSRGEDPELIAYDVIEQEADSGSLTVHRITVSEEYGELVPTPSPTAGSPTPTSGSPTGATGSG
jgi:predicted MPP superfamily phosphohydrolase